MKKTKSIIVHFLTEFFYLKLQKQIGLYLNKWWESLFTFVREFWTSKYLIFIIKVLGLSFTSENEIVYRLIDINKLFDATLFFSF